MTGKRFTLGMDDKNGVGLFDGEARLLYIRFSNFEDTVRCKDALKHHCNLMNKVYEENQSLNEFVNQLQEELVLFKKAGADMSNDLNTQINNLIHENQKQKREYRKLYDEMQDVYKSYRKELRKNTQLTETIHRICAEHHINSKYYLEEEE